MPIFVPTGMGKRLPPTAKIIVQIHYPEYASGQTDSTKINFLFTSVPVRNISDAPVLNHTTSITDGPLFIPKNTNHLATVTSTETLMVIGQRIAA